MQLTIPSFPLCFLFSMIFLLISQRIVKKNNKAYSKTHENMVLLKITGGEIVPEIEMPLSETIFYLKEKIQKVLDVEVDRQSLWYNTRELKNRECIGDYDFRHNETLNLTVTPVPERRKLHVLVKHDGCDGYVRVRETDKVCDLRRKVEKYWGIPPEGFTLSRLNVEMEDGLPLYAYYVNENSEVELSLSVEPR